ncbi:MAG: methylated-DNA--[protein]-cysteine S-methyltransferase [Verrucomicrobiales bacterium]|nr:methylated-DNA--[protein]-cysteine S-methyltransferase [Verrucomicrobiales bacterium]
MPCSPPHGAGRLPSRRLQRPGNLAGLQFPRKTKSAAVPADSLPPAQKRWAKLTATALTRALQGRSVTALPPFDESAGTDFQREVWQALRAIPAGETRTYAELARTLGRPRSARAVGQACGANPIPILTPCHRAVASGGGLGGFSGGLDWKRRLLAGERKGA